MTEEPLSLEDFLSKEASDPVRPMLHPGEEVGSWRIVAFLGGGGFGEVYRVEHVRLGIICALKILKRDTANARARFEQEVSFVARHGFSGVPRFYEFGMHDVRPYFVMEILSPRELPSADRSVASFIREVCQIVSALHDAGYVHRDIKPSNLLYRENGDLVLVDYGLIKPINNGRLCARKGKELTQENVALGTPRYAAPEQLAGSGIDRQADIHALGVIIDTCYNHRLPLRWRRIVCRATSSLSEQRYPSCVAFARAVRLRYLWDALFACLILTFTTVTLIAVRVTPAWLRQTRTSVVPAEEVKDKTAGGKNVSDSAAEWLIP